MRYIIAVLLMIGFLAPAQAQTPEDISRRINAGDCAGLFAAVAPKAEVGDAVAERQLGAMYYNGCGAPKDAAFAIKWYGVAARQNDPIAARMMGILTEIGFGSIPKNPAAAVPWYETAINAGDTWAMVQRGRIYIEGEGGTPVDEVAALALWRRAADRSDATAMYELGLFYIFGSKHVAKDLRAAREWLEKAASAGHVDAKYHLAIMYHDGEGGPRDWRRSAMLRLEAVKLGHVEAMADLGNMYENGEGGLPQDFATALQLYRLAAAGGSELGSENLRKLTYYLQHPQPTYTGGTGGGGGYSPIISPGRQYQMNRMRAPGHDCSRPGGGGGSGC